MWCYCPTRVFFLKHLSRAFRKSQENPEQGESSTTQINAFKENVNTSRRDNFVNLVLASF